MITVRTFAARCLAATLAIAAVAAAGPAAASDHARFEAVAGTWKGPGEIVAGKYKGTRFNCALAGDPNTAATPGLTMEGACRVGVFSQKMSARIVKSGQSYTGHFLDGAAGKGLDVVSGDVSDDRFIFAINRQQLNGAMVADLTDPDTLNVTVSVRVGERMVPVIGMTLSRQSDPITVGSVR